MVCFRYITVNTVHNGDNKDDDDDDYDNNNNNNSNNNNNNNKLIWRKGLTLISAPNRI